MSDSPISLTSPRYLLFSEWSESREGGRWRFVIRANDGPEEFEASDVDPDVRGQRLELLPVVLGLESLDQPSRVTLMTPSGYVREGIAHGIDEWSSNGWRWERFGKMVPVKNLDLWQRVDRAMKIHRVECRTWRIDPPQRSTPVFKGLLREGGKRAVRSVGGRRSKSVVARLLMGTCRGLLRGIGRWRRGIFGDSATLAPSP